MDAINIASDMTMASLVILALAMDLRTSKISNRLILTGLIMGLIFSLLQRDISSFAQYLLGIFFPVFLLFILYVFRILGPGDIKLFSMIGGFINFKELLWCIGLSFVIGAILSFGLLLVRRRLIAGLKNGLTYIGGLMWGDLKPYETRGDQRDLMHFSLAIAIALAVVKGGFV